MRLRSEENGNVAATQYFDLSIAVSSRMRLWEDYAYQGTLLRPLLPGSRIWIVLTAQVHDPLFMTHLILDVNFFFTQFRVQLETESIIVRWL